MDMYGTVPDTLYLVHYTKCPYRVYDNLLVSMQGLLPVPLLYAHEGGGVCVCWGMIYLIVHNDTAAANTRYQAHPTIIDDFRTSTRQGIHTRYC